MKRVGLSDLWSLCDLTADPLKRGFASVEGVSFKAPDDPVTSTDLEVSSLLVRELCSRGFPVSQIISEESAHTGGFDPEAPYWVIDPIDGTKEFIAGVPEFALSVAYFEHGLGAGGVVFNPISGFRIAGTNAEGLRRALPADATMDDRLLCSRTEHRKGLLSKLEERRTVLPVGSVAHKLGLVAAGMAVGTLTYEPKNTWDIAAGVYLVRLAGGSVRTLSGRNLIPKDPFERIHEGFLAAAPGVDFNTIFADFVAAV